MACGGCGLPADVFDGMTVMAGWAECGHGLTDTHVTYTSASCFVIVLAFRNKRIQLPDTCLLYTSDAADES